MIVTGGKRTVHVTQGFSPLQMVLSLISTVTEFSHSYSILLLTRPFREFLSLYKVIFYIFKISEKINKKNFFTKLKKGLWIETLAFII